MDGDYKSEFSDNINDKFIYQWGVDQYIINSIFTGFPLISENISLNRYDIAFDHSQMTWHKIQLLLEDKILNKNSEERNEKVRNLINEIHNLFDETERLFYPSSAINPNIRNQEERENTIKLRENLRKIHGFLWIGIKESGLWLKVKASIPITEALRENFVY